MAGMVSAAYVATTDRRVKVSILSRAKKTTPADDMPGMIDTPAAASGNGGTGHAEPVPTDEPASSGDPAPADEWFDYVVDEADAKRELPIGQWDATVLKTKPIWSEKNGSHAVSLNMEVTVQDPRSGKYVEHRQNEALWMPISPTTTRNPASPKRTDGDGNVIAPSNLYWRIRDACKCFGVPEPEVVGGKYKFSREFWVGFEGKSGRLNVKPESTYKDRITGEPKTGSREIKFLPKKHASA